MHVSGPPWCPGLARPPAHPPTGLTVLIPDTGPLILDHSQGSGALPCCLSGAGGTIPVLSRFIRYSLFAALSGLMGEGLGPYLPQITTLMLLSLRSTEGIVVSRGWVLTGPVRPG